MSNPTNTGLTFPDQRVSFKTKQTPDWTKSNADFVVQLAQSHNDKNKVYDFLNMANGYVSKDMYAYMFKTYGLKEAKDFGVPDKDSDQNILSDLRDIDFLQPIKDKMLGEFVSSYNNYQVYTDDPNAVFVRNKAFGAVISEIMNQKVINILNAQKIDTGAPTKEMPDIQNMIKEFTYEWDDTRVDEAQKRLNLLNTILDAKLKYTQLYYYWWACEECYTFRTIHKNDVIFEVVPPYEYYRVPSGNYYVEDDDFGARIFHRNMYQILDLYEEYLDTEDINYLKQLTINNFETDTRVGFLRSRCIRHGMTDNDFISIDHIKATHNDFSNSPFTNFNNIPMVHYFFKTEVKIGYLTYINEVGETVETIVDEDYKLDKESGDIAITWDWKHEIYQGEIIGFNSGGNNLEAIYTKPRPLDIEREKFTNINVCKAPYNGISFIHEDSQKKPIPYRINPFLALIRIYTYQMEKAINNWKSILTIPQSVLTDKDMSIDERMAKLNGESILVFDDTEVGANSLQAMKEISTQATYNYCNTIRSLIEAAKEDIMTVANMNPSRSGNQAPYQGKSVTENSIAQANIAGSWGMEQFNSFRGRDYLANYDHSKVAWAEGRQGSFTKDDTNEQVFVEVNPFEHFAFNIGINVGNSRLFEEKLKAMKELAFNASQGGNFDLATEAILNDNLQVLKRRVLDLTKAKQEYEAKMAEAQSQRDAQLEEIRQQGIVAEGQNKLAVAQISADAEVNTALINQQTQLLIWDKRLQIDKNGNGYISDKEMDNTEVDNTMEKMRLNLKKEDTLIKQKTLKNNENKPTK